MQDHYTLATAIDRQDAQSSLPISLPSLSFVDENCSESYRPPISCHAHQKTKPQFANHRRPRRCAQSWLTAIQYVSNILLCASCRLRAFGAVGRVKFPEVVGYLRLTTGKSSYFR